MNGWFGGSTNAKPSDKQLGVFRDGRQRFASSLCTLSLKVDALRIGASHTKGQEPHVDRGELGIVGNGDRHGEAAVAELPRLVTECDDLELRLDRGPTLGGGVGDLVGRVCLDQLEADRDLE
jgi:hypothetical protein